MPKEFFNYDEYLRLSTQATNQIIAGANRASDIAVETADLNKEVINESAAAAQKFLAPFRAAGSAGLKELTNLLGLNGEQAQADSTQRILNSPQVEQQLNIGRRNVESSAAAQGTLGSGRFLNDLFQRGQETAVNEIARNQNLLLQLSGQGQNAAIAAAGIEQNRGSQIVGQNLFAGQTRANSALAIGNAQAALSQQHAQVDLQRQQDRFFLQSLALGGGAPQAPNLGGSVDFAARSNFMPDNLTFGGISNKADVITPVGGGSAPLTVRQRIAQTEGAPASSDGGTTVQSGNNPFGLAGLL